MLHCPKLSLSGQEETEGRKVEIIEYNTAVSRTRGDIEEETKGIIGTLKCSKVETRVYNHVASRAKCVI